MSLGEWFEAGGVCFVWQQAMSLLDRYGVSPGKAIHLIGDCVETLTGLDCAPTFARPGIVVQRHPQFIRNLQDSGAEKELSMVHKIPQAILDDQIVPELGDPIYPQKRGRWRSNIRSFLRH